MLLSFGLHVNNMDYCVLRSTENSLSSFTRHFSIKLLNVATSAGLILHYQEIIQNMYFCLSVFSVSTLHILRLYSKELQSKIIFVIDFCLLRKNARILKCVNCYFPWTFREVNQISFGFRFFFWKTKCNMAVRLWRAFWKISCLFINQNWNGKFCWRYFKCLKWLISTQIMNIALPSQFC